MDNSSSNQLNGIFFKNEERIKIQRHILVSIKQLIRFNLIKLNGIHYILFELLYQFVTLLLHDYSRNITTMSLSLLSNIHLDTILHRFGGFYTVIRDCSAAAAAAFWILINECTSDSIEFNSICTDRPHLSNVHVRQRQSNRKMCWLVHNSQQTSIRQTLPFHRGMPFIDKKLHMHSTKQKLIILLIFNVESINRVRDILINRLLLHTNVLMRVFRSIMSKIQKNVWQTDFVRIHITHPCTSITHYNRQQRRLPHLIKWLMNGLDGWKNTQAYAILSMNKICGIFEFAALRIHDVDNIKYWLVFTFHQFNHNQSANTVINSMLHKFAQDNLNDKSPLLSFNKERDGEELW